MQKKLVIQAPELQDAINGDAQALARFETIRAYGAKQMGLIQEIAEAEKRQHTPKIAFVAAPKSYVSSSGKTNSGRRYRFIGTCFIDG